MSTKSREWIENSTLAERKKAVNILGIGMVFFVRICKEQETASLATSINMARAMRIVRSEGGAEAKARLPLISRGDVSPMCAACSYFQICDRVGIRETGENERPAELKGKHLTRKK